ncbi:MAG TPA: phosphoadenylyl-sulfate reductase [Dehalococcoidia bacterium]|nr:phosphoadenylyl-sulfate reductase [Dehalococcoidia bacterium]HLB29118.1 phosphoadenylyl-sulfate reductase [Dehalococcoidia bacterium]
MVATFTPEDLQTLGKGLEGRSPQEAIAWALETFNPDIALACSFGAEDVALVDMAVKIRPDVQIFYLDTELLFPETYEVRDRLIEKYNIQPVRYRPFLSVEDQAKVYGDELWTQNPDLCCGMRKVQPLTQALKPLKAWITGIRRDQAPTRANAGIVEWDGKFNLVKVNPLAPWTWDQVWSYISENQVPYCALHDQGYPSIGCAPCTRRVAAGEDPRAGRWSGFQKTECGLHQ